MDRSGIQALHVVESQRRIDEEPEQPRAHEVPERHPHEEAKGPTIAAHPGGCALHPRGLEGFQADEHQWHDLERAEARADGHDRSRSAAEVEVMKGPWDSTDQKQRARGHNCAAGMPGLHQAQLGEDESEGSGSEYLEEALDPEMNDPPAPVFHHGQVGARTEEKARSVHQTDGDTGSGEHQDERAILTSALQGGPQPP